tara:strand:- start:532 stop:897 length:366 start_codon:yes stop_codon:yes gene_type:complete
MDKKARGALDSYKKIELEKKNVSSQKVNTNKKSNDKTHQLIIESLNAAKLEIKGKPKITENRRALINEIKKLQSSKLYILDQLSGEQRQKLRALALCMFKGEALPLKEPEIRSQNKKKQSL